MPAGAAEDHKFARQKISLYPLFRELHRLRRPTSRRPTSRRPTSLKRACPCPLLYPLIWPLLLPLF